jgi:hypothetical protein
MPQAEVVRRKSGFYTSCVPCTLNGDCGFEIAGFSAVSAAHGNLIDDFADDSEQEEGDSDEDSDGGDGSDHIGSPLSGLLVLLTSHYVTYGQFFRLHPDFNCRNKRHLC